MMNSFVYRLMVLEYRLKAAFSPPQEVLAEIPLRSGMTVLDFGCGPGRYTIPAARLVGESGLVYALDAHPLAIRTVERVASKKGLRNIRTIHSNLTTAIEDRSVDVVLLYDTLHEVREPSRLVGHLHSVLKAGGLLSFRDRHLKEDEAHVFIVGGSLFTPFSRGKRTHTFIKRELDENEKP